MFHTCSDQMGLAPLNLEESWSKQRSHNFAPFAPDRRRVSANLFYGDVSSIALYGCEAEHLHRYRQRIERRLVVAGWKDGTHWCIRQSHSLRPSSTKAGRIEVAVAARPFES